MKNKKRKVEKICKKIYKLGLVFGVLSLLLFNGISNINAVSLTSLYGDTSSAEETPTNLIVDFDSTKVDTTLRAGDSGVLQITLENTGDKPAENVDFLIYDNPYIKAQGKFELGTIEGGTSKIISKVIRVKEDTPPGLYILTVVAIFDIIDSNGKRTTDVERRWEIPIRVYGSPNFQLSLKEGKNFFKNINNILILKGLSRASVKETSAKLTSNCVNVIGSSKKYIGDLNKDQGFTLEYLIKPYSTGICPLTISFEYYDISGSLNKEDLDIGIDVQPSDINFKIEDVTPSTLTYGCVKNLTIYLKNLGASTAKDVTVKLDLSEPFTALKSSEKYIGSFLSKETKEIKFEILVDTNVEKRAYEIPLIIEYYDASGEKKTSKKEIGMQISGEPEISLSLESSDPFTKGSKGKISVEVVNSAFTDVKFLTIKLIPTEAYKVLSSSEIYIGNLDSDDTDTEDFEIQLSNNVNEGTINLKFEIKYREEGSNIEYTETKEVPLTVLSPSDYGKARPSGVTRTILSVISLVVGGFILIIVIWLLYRVLKLIIFYLDKKIFKRKI